jgi:hypothetical protein
MGGCILYKVQSFIGGGEVFLCMSVHSLPIKSLQASELNLRLKRSTIQVARKHFSLALILITTIINVNILSITTGQTNWYKIKCMGLIKTS